MKLHRIPFRAMGSPCELQLYAADETVAAQAAEAARNRIEQLEARYSRYRDDSLLSRINAAAGTGQWIAVDAETAGLLDYAAQAWEQSDGRFDITSGVLRRAWDFHSGQPPAQHQLDALLPLIGWNQVEWQKPRLRLPRAGMEIDLGGLVKEYAADCAAQVCLSAGIRHGLVELGGDIHAIGPHPDGAPWIIGIRHPRAPEQAIASVPLSRGGLASSGDYERFILIGNERHCHILNPLTGRSVQGLAGVSVIAPQCLVAGTATTIAMLRENQGLPWLQALGLPFLAIDQAGRVQGSLAPPIPIKK